MDVRDGEPHGLPSLSWVFATIRHRLLASALPPRSSGTDRGRQTASQRITGGLVSHWQEKARPVGVAGSQGGLFLVGDPVGDPGELSLAEVEVLSLPWAMGAGGHRHLAADLLEGQLGHQQLPRPRQPGIK
jgi:hypothetical protein